MKKDILITSFDLAIGGVERSLIGLLNHLDYSKYNVDLLLFRHEGEFFSLLPSKPNLLTEIPEYATFRQSINQTVKGGFYKIAFSRLLAKCLSTYQGRVQKIKEPGYLTIQYAWKLTNPFLPKINKKYDAAISFLWPHYFVTEKVNAKKRIGWIHTDYSNIHLNDKLENQMWNKLDHIVAVSDDCLNNFLSKHPGFKGKSTVIENILSPHMVKEQAKNDSTEIKKIPEKTFILTVGRLSHAKGLDYAIKACKQLVDQGFNIEWHVVGYGPLENDLADQIIEEGIQGHFKLLGKKTNPYPYIQSCDIYVQPSRYEGKAVTIREAQILGKPVVMTDFPTARSQAQNEIDALITPLSIEGIVNGIKRVLLDQKLKERLISNVKRVDYGNVSEVEKLYHLIGD
ncbi:group 1 glycosyl transferase [Bacillus freudenreichii]|nr:group 1 glycosyl transferase [Bacillus freudenreichii]